MVIAKYLAGRNVRRIPRGSVKVPKPPGLVIEFVGPTGSGKTTNCRCFAERLRKENLKVYEFGDIKAHLYKLGFHSRLLIYLHALVLNCPHLISFSFLLASHGIFSLESIYRYAKLCVFQAALDEVLGYGRADVVLLDQWAIQGLWSATIFKARSVTGLETELKRFYFKAQYVLYFDIDENTASDRIRLRASGRSRFDRMDNKRRVAELKRYNQYLHRLYENSDCVHKLTFSTRVTPEENAEVFYHYLEQSLRGGYG